MSRDPYLYLDDIVEAITKIRNYTNGIEYEIFSRDEKTVDAVIRNLEVLGEAVKNVPEEMKIQFPDIEWRKIVAIRNLMIHEYFGINKYLIWDIVTTKLDSLFEAVDSLLKAEQIENS